LHPVALSRTWKINIMTRENLFLTVVRQAVVKFADDYFAQNPKVVSSNPTPAAN
jgi:hypothetical protein